MPNFLKTVGFLLISLSLEVFSQPPCTGEISGSVFDLDTKSPLPYATIQILGTDIGVISDQHGNFIIKELCENIEVDLQVRFVGYKTVIHHHDFHHNDPAIFLAPEEGILESVVVEENLNVHDLETIATSTISIAALEGAGKSAGELFEMASGVSLLKTGQNIAKPIVHGLHSNRVLIINNGVRHAYQAWGTEHGPEIDPTQIDRIQLVKGASTVRYGSEALGGVILFDAPSPSYNTRIGGEVNGGYQTNGRAYNGELALQQGFERIAWRAAVSGIKQGDLRAPDYQLTNTGKEELGISLGGKFHFPFMDIDIYASRFDQTLGILRGSVNGSFQDILVAFNAEVPNETGPFSYGINNPKQQTRHDLLRLKTSLFLGEHQFDIQYAYQRNLREEFDIRRGSRNSRPAIDLELTSQSLDIDWDHPSKGIWSGTYGMQLMTQDNNNLFGTGTTPFIPNYNTITLGVFGIESLKTANTTYEVGLRYDFINLDVRGRDINTNIFRNNQDYQSFSFTLGMIKPLNNHLTLRMNVGSSWRPPNIGELYAYGRHRSENRYGIWRYQIDTETNTLTADEVLTNEDLEVKNEQGIKWIGSLEIKKETLSLEITPYVNWIQNYFFTRPFGLIGTRRGVFPNFIYDQTNALYTGIDIDLIHNWNETTSIELKASYVYARDLNNHGFFIGIPPINLQAALIKGFGNFEFSLSPSWTARQYHAPPVVSPEEIINAQSPPFESDRIFDLMEVPSGYLLVNATIKYKKDNFRVRVSGENLLNNAYRRYTDSIRYYADEPGINGTIQIIYSF